MTLIHFQGPSKVLFYDICLIHCEAWWRKQARNSRMAAPLRQSIRRGSCHHQESFSSPIHYVFLGLKYCVRVRMNFYFFIIKKTKQKTYVVFWPLPVFANHFIWKTQSSIWICLSHRIILSSGTMATTAISSAIHRSNWRKITGLMF